MSTSRVSYEEYRQYNLFDREKYDRLEKCNQAIDTIRARFGEDSVMRASFLKTELSHTSGGLNKEKRAELLTVKNLAEEGKKRRLRRLSQPFAFLSRIRDMADWVFCTFWVCRNSEGVQAL